MPRSRLLLLLAVSAGCGGGASDPAATPSPTATASPSEAVAPARTPDDGEQIAALLARRARALGGGDAQALARTAIGAQRAGDRTAARRAEPLPLAGVTLSATGATARGTGVVDVRADLGYRVRGVPGRFITRRRLVVVRTPAGWRVRRDRPVRDAPPWEAGAFTAWSARRALVLAPRGFDAVAVTTAAASAYAKVRQRLPGRRVPQRVLVVVAGDLGQARTLLGTARGPEGLSALADSVVTESGPALRVRRVLSQRLLVLADRWAELDAEGRERVLAHELVHVALAPTTSGRVPAWLLEGVALHLSGDDRRAEARARAAGGRRGRLARLSRPGAIGGLSGEAQTAAYVTASAAAETIVARVGVRGLLTLYDAFGDESIPGPPGPRLTDRVLRRTLGGSLAQLERAIE